MSRRATIIGRDEAKPEKTGLALLSGLIGLVAFAYVLGTPDLAGKFPPTMERALINMRKDFDQAGENTRTGISNIHQTISGFIPAR
jgi:hypothetical protein